MQKTTRDLISAFVLMIVAFLVLTHYTGASRIIGALGNSVAGLARTFQGR